MEEHKVFYSNMMGAKGASEPNVRPFGGRRFILTIRCKTRAHEKVQDLISVRVLGRLSGESSLVRCQDWIEAESLEDSHD